VDGPFPGAHVHTPVDRLHPARQRVHAAEDGPVPDALPGPASSSSSFRSARDSGGPSNTSTASSGTGATSGVTEFGQVEYFLSQPPFSTVLRRSCRHGNCCSPAPVSTARSGRTPALPGKNRVRSPRPPCSSPASALRRRNRPRPVFALVWVAPPTLLISLAALRRETHSLSGITSGDWRPAISSVVAALLCGFFWEMWNFGSAAKWVYDIPYVNVLHVFEMPLLGYAGYPAVRGAVRRNRGFHRRGRPRGTEKIPVSQRVG